MKHVWSVLCSRGIIDKKSNNVSLIEVIEELKLFSETNSLTEEAANVIGQMSADWVTLWIRSNLEEPERGAVRDAIIAPSGKIIVEREYEVDLQTHKRNRTTRRIMLPPARESGVYLLRTQLRSERRKNWKTMSDVPLDVTIEIKIIKEASGLPLLS